MDWRKVYAKERSWKTLRGEEEIRKEEGKKKVEEK